MTRDEVIKALELCGFDPDPGQELQWTESCDICPYWDDMQGCRMPDMFNDVLALLKAEPKRGRWTTHRTQQHDGEWYCSECGYEPTVYEGTPYCPNCGAKMEADDETS